MMTQAEHLLIILAEECSEVAQRASKALRFGLDEIQPGQGLSNEARLVEEIADLYAVVELLLDEDIIYKHGLHGSMRQLVDAKKDKVARFMRYSRRVGTLEKQKGG